MKTLNFSFKTLIAVFLFSVLIQSCTKNDTVLEDTVTANETANIDPSQYNSTVEEIGADHPFIKILQSSDQIKAYDEAVSGKLIWENSNLITYDTEEALPMLMIPIDNGQDVNLIKVLMASYDQRNGMFTMYVNELEFDKNAGQMEEGFSGAIGFKTIENELFSKTTIEKGTILEQQNFDIENIESRGINMHCYTRCMSEFGAAALQSGVTQWCQSFVPLCIYHLTPYNPACIGLAGCMLFYGGYAANCAWQCNY